MSVKKDVYDTILFIRLKQILKDNGSCLANLETVVFEESNSYMSFDKYKDYLSHHLNDGDCVDIKFNKNVVFIGKKFMVSVICQDNIIKLKYTRIPSTDGYVIAGLSDVLSNVTYLVNKEF